MGFKKVMRWDDGNRIFRIARFTWTKGARQDIGKGEAYSAKLSLGISLKPFECKSCCDGFTICLLGLRVHFQKSFGGIYV